MPGLNDIDPQGELVRRIHALEADLRRVSTLRRRPSPGATLQAANTSQTFTGTSTVGNASQVSLGTTIVDTVGMADPTNSRIIVPSDGVYLVAWQSGALENSTDYGFSGQAGIATRDTGGAVIAGTYGLLVTEYGYGTERSHAAVCPLEADDTVRLFCQSFGAGLDKLQNSPATGGTTVLFRLSVVRLHDLPA